MEGTETTEGEGGGGEREEERGEEKNMWVDRTGRSKGEVNTASGDSIRFPSGLLRLPPWDEGKAV